jgi:hypothetical protein
VRVELGGTNMDTTQDVLQTIYNELMAEQKPLDTEYQAVLYKNLFELYDSGEDLHGPASGN